ncbi:RidA family protein [Albimonas pacifica]|uniref:Enamine deaminase RidA, house cleaning of reactive enamine intermediates, YjgF/YER057c/UK114 family n=1 Tax=Albimonas pacifica TaxID=1114924 RepID=A0A1I3LLL9_9RHOB|nr:RidA family protein [Albimonas pacifica]SFI85621.1 Enamine deaminase RidA, house cleaning of reactive enamine intermediates, YjgF/YER057c/UK114 family [Albimonas pacifica]
MKRTPVNPLDWSAALPMSQGELIEGASRRLRIAGQGELWEDPDDPAGLGVGCPGDMARQLEAALSNVDAVLSAAGMARRHLVQVRLLTTDMRALLAEADAYAAWIAEAGVAPPLTLIGVAALVHPDLMVMVEAEAEA